MCSVFSALLSEFKNLPISLFNDILLTVGADKAEFWWACDLHEIIAFFG